MVETRCIWLVLVALASCGAEGADMQADTAPRASAGTTSAGADARGPGGSAGAALGGSAGLPAGAGGLGGRSGAGGSAGSFSDRPEPSVELTFMTFNVRTKDADSADAAIGNDWPKRVGLALEVLSDHAPDVVGLQEATAPQVDALSAGFQVLSAPGVAVLYNATKLEALEGDVLNVGKYGNSDIWGERWCNLRRFRIKQSNSEFVFLNTHLSTAADNVPQSQFVFDQANAWHSKGLPVIVVGDFNFDASRMLSEQGFTDVLTDRGGTFHAFGGGRSGPRLDFIAAKGVTVIDSGVDARSDSSSGRAVYPSDHYPVWAVLRL